MRLVRLRIESLPGVHPGFEVAGFDPGVNVVIGPNASGKSSLLRAVRALLYREEQAGAGAVLEGVFADGTGELRVRRVGDDIRWSREGREVPAPDLPPHRLLSCYTLGVEDLTTSGATDREIADELSRQLAGGYDLNALRTSAPLRLKANHGQTESRRLRSSTEALASVERERRALHREQKGIGRWAEEVEAAEVARRDAAAHQRALELLTARAALRRQAALLEPFPEGMDRLNGDELERLSALEGARDRHAAELDGAREAQRAAGARLAASGLADSSLNADQVDAWRARLRDVRRLEGEARAWEDRARAARADLEAARRGLAAPPPAALPTTALPADAGGSAPRPRLDPASLSAVDDALSDKRTIEAELRQLDHALETLPTEADPSSDPARLRSAREALLRALAAPRRRRWWPARGLGVLLASASLGGAVAVAFLAGAPALALAALVVGGLAGLALAVGDADAARRRRSAFEALRASGAGAPTTPDDSRLHERLKELDEALARAEVQALQLEERRAAERRRQAARRRLAEVEASLEALAASVGFDPRRLDAGVQRWLRLLDVADRAEDDLRQATSALEHVGPELRDATSSLDVFLRDHGVADAGAAPGSEVLEARLDALAARLSERDEARRELERASADIVRAERAQADRTTDIAALVDAAGLTAGSREALAEARRELQRRLDELESFRQARDAWRDAKVLERDRAAALTERTDLLAAVDADDEAGIRHALAGHEAIAEAGSEAAEHLAATRALIEHAERDRALERAVAERQAAADALADRVDEALRAEAGLFLLETVENEYERSSQPAALRRASNWFQRFTRDHYELRFEGAEAAFAAFETASGERRSLAELSTGTRAQLLLAVRIAFAMEAERGVEPLPLYLDEALTTADADRFRAVGASLALLARDDARQLFYLTARPEDASLWQSQAAPSADGDVTVLDLARIRTGSATVSGPSELALPSRAEPPAPDDLAPEAYAGALGVRPIDPWQPPQACHVFHLLRDDLPLLHRLLRAGVERLGTLRTFLGGPAAAALLPEDDRHRLRRRLAGASAYLEVWRRGRGRPVDRAALETADGVSATFLDRIDTLAERVGRDAAALLTALEDGEVARYRAKDRDQLRDWLEQHGYLADRAPLDEAGLRQQVVAALARAATGPGDGPPAATPAARDPDALLTEGTALARWLTAGIEARRSRRASDTPR